MSEANVAPKGVDQKYCADCGAIISLKAEICPKCGVRQTAPVSHGMQTTPSGKSKLAAALFAILLGGLGVHKFYLGRIGWGVVYIVFFWTFIPTILGFIEGIIYLTMSDEAFATKYG